MNELVKKSTKDIKDKLYSCIESTFEKIESVKHDLSCIYEGVANDLDILNANEEQIPYSEAYNKGLEDGRKEAWELAKKISDIPTTQERADIFGFVRCGITVGDILRNMDYQEALAKLEAYEKEQEINVGDVVSCTETKGTAVVAKKPTDNEIYILWNDGSTGRHNIEDFKKTGKHIDISSILEQIKEN